MRRSGSVRNVLNDMQFSRIGKLIPKFVALKSISVTVEPSSQGKNLINLNLVIIDTNKLNHGTFNNNNNESKIPKRDEREST